LSPFIINKKKLFLFKKRKPKSIKKKTLQTSQKLKMPSSHSLPNSLLLLIVLLVTIFFGNANSTFVHYSGHVYCNVSTADGKSSSVLPVKNVDMALMEADGWFFYNLIILYNSGLTSKNSFLETNSYVRMRQFLRKSFSPISLSYSYDTIDISILCANK
jgi:hypothetical protein